MQYFEDIRVESMRRHGPGRVISAEEIKCFAAEFDPMPFHLDEEAAKASILGGLCASSVHVLALGTQLSHAHRGDSEGMVVSSALGWDEVRLKRPLFAGDHVRVQSYVESKRESASRSDCGIVILRTEIVLADGSVVASYKVSLLVDKRPHQETDE
ncbi:MAG: acyl dehydratase [bacterium]|nr:acyl dehydratase [bacterium]